jgi:hypothetical protein
MFSQAMALLLFTFSFCSRIREQALFVNIMCLIRDKLAFVMLLL